MPGGKAVGLRIQAYKLIIIQHVQTTGTTSIIHRSSSVAHWRTRAAHAPFLTKPALRRGPYRFGAALLDMSPLSVWWELRRVLPERLQMRRRVYDVRNGSGRLKRNAQDTNTDRQELVLVFPVIQTPRSSNVVRATFERRKEPKEELENKAIEFVSTSSHVISSCSPLRTTRGRLDWRAAQAPVSRPFREIHPIEDKFRTYGRPYFRVVRGRR